MRDVGAVFTLVLSVCALTDAFVLLIRMVYFVCAVPAALPEWSKYAVAFASHGMDLPETAKRSFMSVAERVSVIVAAVGGGVSHADLEESLHEFCKEEEMNVEAALVTRHGKCQTDGCDGKLKVDPRAG
jgi:hypothetical protein